MNTNEKNASPMTEELVAYIDGELDDARRAAVESQIERDAEYRAEYESLCQSWDLLDHLPTANASEDFTRTTIGMATVSLAEERTVAQRNAQRHMLARRLLAIAGLSVAALAAFWAVALPYSRHEQQRLTDVPVIESMDLYMHAASVDFLRELLATSTTEATPMDQAFGLLTDIHEIRERTKQLTPQQKQALVKKRERFERLSDEQQNDFRSLHQQLSDVDDGPELFSVLTQYQQWLKKLPASERAGLLELSPEKRVVRIHEIKDRQERERFHEEVASVLTPDDAKVILQWIERYVTLHEDELIAQLPAGMPRPEPGSEMARRRRLGFIMFTIGKPDSDVKLPPPSQDELAELSNRLSSESRVKLDEAKDEKAQLELVREWLVAAARIRFRGPDISKERLHKFYSEELSTEHRQRLEKLPARELQNELRRLYFDHHPELRRGRGWGRGPSRGGPGGNRGGPRPGEPRN